MATMTNPEILCPHILQVIGDYLHCDIVMNEQGDYELILRPCRYFEILTDRDGNNVCVPCHTM